MNKWHNAAVTHPHQQWKKSDEKKNFVKAGIALCITWLIQSSLEEKGEEGSPTANFDSETTS